MGTLTAFGEQSVAQFTALAGWSFAYNINPDMVNAILTVGTVTYDDNHAVLSTGAVANQGAKIETVRAIRYIPGHGGKARFTARFTPGVAGSTQIIGVGDDQDGFFVGFNGETFGVMRRRDGADTWVPIDEWNQASTAFQDYFDPAKGNVFQILWQWLGYGIVSFWMEETTSGQFYPLHTVRYANLNTETSIRNPTLPLMAEVANTTNDTDIVLRTPSAIGGIDGMIFGPDPIHPFSYYRTAAAEKLSVTTQAAIISLRNNATFQGIANRVRARLTALSVASDGTKNVTLRLILGTTLGGTPSFGDWSASRSPVSVDTAGTTVVGGAIVLTLALGKVDSQMIDLSLFGIELAPGETITLTAQSATANDISCSLTWVDLF